MQAPGERLPNNFQCGSNHLHLKSESPPPYSPPSTSKPKNQCDSKHETNKSFETIGMETFETPQNFKHPASQHSEYVSPTGDGRYKMHDETIRNLSFQTILSDDLEPKKITESARQPQAIANATAGLLKNPTSNSEPGLELIGGRYRIMQQVSINVARRSKLFEGHDSLYNVDVMLKITKDAFTFEREVRWLEHLQAKGGSNYVVIIQNKLRNFDGLGSHCIVMEKGHCSLLDRIHDVHLEESDVKVVARQLLDCLHFLRSARVVHCDIKPENLIYFRTGRTGHETLKLIDFETCVEDGTVLSGATPSLKYTLTHCAPEMAKLLLKSRALGLAQEGGPQLHNETLRVDSSLDVWGFGMTIMSIYNVGLVRDANVEPGSKQETHSLEQLAGLSDENLAKHLGKLPKLTRNLLTSRVLRVAASQRSSAADIMQSSFIRGGSDTVEQERSHQQLQQSIGKLSESLQWGLDRQFTLSLQLSTHGACPRTFLLLPTKGSIKDRVRFRKSFKLHLLCEFDGKPHLLPEDRGSYKVTKPNDFLKTASPYVKVTLLCLKYAAKAGRLLGLPVPELGGGAGNDGKEESYFSDLASAYDTLMGDDEKEGFSEVLKEASMASSEEQQLKLLGGLVANAKGMEGGGHRALQALLTSLDPSSSWGGLQCVASKSGKYPGKVMWVCQQCRHDHANLFSLHSSSDWQKAPGQASQSNPKVRDVAQQREKAKVSEPAEVILGEDVDAGTMAFRERVNACLEVLPSEKGSQAGVQDFHMVVAVGEATVVNPKWVTKTIMFAVTTSLQVSQGPPVVSEDLSFVGITVHRKYEDFVWLHRTLEKGNMLPSGVQLPKSKWFGASSPKFLEQRRNDLQAYLSALIKFSVRHVMFKLFLACKDEKEFKGIMAQSNTSYSTETSLLIELHRSEPAPLTELDAALNLHDWLRCSVEAPTILLHWQYMMQKCNTSALAPMSLADLEQQQEEISSELLKKHREISSLNSGAQDRIINHNTRLISVKERCRQQREVDTILFLPVPYEETQLRDDAWNTLDSAKNMVDSVTSMFSKRNQEEILLEWLQLMEVGIKERTPIRALPSRFNRLLRHAQGQIAWNVDSREFPVLDETLQARAQMIAVARSRDEASRKVLYGLQASWARMRQLVASSKALGKPLAAVRKSLANEENVLREEIEYLDGESLKRKEKERLIEQDVEHKTAEIAIIEQHRTRYTSEEQRVLAIEESIETLENWVVQQPAKADRLLELIAAAKGCVATVTSFVVQQKNSSSILLLEADWLEKESLRSAVAEVADSDFASWLRKLEAEERAWRRHLQSFESDKQTNRSHCSILSKSCPEWLAVSQWELACDGSLATFEPEDSFAARIERDRRELGKRVAPLKDALSDEAKRLTEEGPLLNRLSELLEKAKLLTSKHSGQLQDFRDLVDTHKCLIQEEKTLAKAKKEAVQRVVTECQRTEEEIKQTCMRLDQATNGCGASQEPDLLLGSVSGMAHDVERLSENQATRESQTKQTLQTVLQSQQSFTRVIKFPDLQDFERDQSEATQLLKALNATRIKAQRALQKNATTRSALERYQRSVKTLLDEAADRTKRAADVLERDPSESEDEEFWFEMSGQVDGVTSTINDNKQRLVNLLEKIESQEHRSRSVGQVLGQVQKRILEQQTMLRALQDGFKRENSAFNSWKEARRSQTNVIVQKLRELQKSGDQIQQAVVSLSSQLQRQENQRQKLVSTRNQVTSNEQLRCKQWSDLDSTANALIDAVDQKIDFLQSNSDLACNELSMLRVGEELSAFVRIKNTINDMVRATTRDLKTLEALPSAFRRVSEDVRKCLQNLPGCERSLSNLQAASEWVGHVGSSLSTSAPDGFQSQFFSKQKRLEDRFAAIAHEIETNSNMSQELVKSINIGIGKIETKAMQQFLSVDAARRHRNFDEQLEEIKTFQQDVEWRFKERQQLDAKRKRQEEERLRQLARDREEKRLRQLAREREEKRLRQLAWEQKEKERREKERWQLWEQKQRDYGPVPQRRGVYPPTQPFSDSDSDNNPGSNFSPPTQPFSDSDSDNNPGFNSTLSGMDCKTGDKVEVTGGKYRGITAYMKANGSSVYLYSDQGRANKIGSCSRKFVRTV